MKVKSRVIIALFFVLLVNYVERVAISFAGPSIMQSLSMTPSEFGTVLSSFGVGYLIAQIPGGLLADRWGAKVLLVCGPILWALATGLTGFVVAVAAFVAVRIGLGFSEGLITPSFYKTIGEFVEPADRPRALAITMSAAMMGMALAGGLASVLITTVGWQMMFVLLAAPALLSALVAYFLIPAAPIKFRLSAKPAPARSPTYRRKPDRRSLTLLSLSNLGTDIAQYGFQGWMPSYLVLARHIDLNSTGYIGGIPYVFAFFGLFVGGWLGTKVFPQHRVQLVVICYLAAGLSLFLSYNAGTMLMAVAGLSSTAFFMYGALAPKGAVVIALTPERTRGTHVGIYNTAGQLGGASAPAIIGFLIGATGAFGSGFTFMIVALCLAASCMLALIPYLSTVAPVERAVVEVQSAD